jgi:hypothetical protein
MKSTLWAGYNLALNSYLKPTLLIPPSTSRAGITDISFSKPTYAIHVESANDIKISRLVIKQATLGITISGNSQYISLEQLTIAGILKRLIH